MRFDGLGAKLHGNLRWPESFLVREYYLSCSSRFVKPRKVYTTDAVLHQITAAPISAR